MRTFLKWRDKFLDELMGLEGRGRFQHSCAGCRVAFPEYRCKDCVHGPLWCKACMLKNHAASPLHVIQVRVRYYLLQSHWPNALLSSALERSVFWEDILKRPGASCPTRPPPWHLLPHQRPRPGGLYCHQHQWHPPRAGGLVSV